MRRIFIPLLFILTTVSAQVEVLTIEKSLQIGLNYSKEIQIANSDTLISEARVTNAWSNLLPKVTLGFNYNHLSTMPIQLNLPIPGPTSENALNAIYANATIEQPLFTGFRLLAIKNASELNNKASIVENSKIKNNKALEIHQAFWSFYKSTKIIEVFEENLKLVKSQINNVKNLVETGVLTQNELLILKVAEADVKSKIIDALNQSKVAQANFNRVIGIKLNSDTKIIAEEYNEEIIDYNFDEILSEAIKSRDELVANKFRIEAANENITAAKSTWFPQISAFGSYNYLKLDGSTLLNDESNNFWMVGVGMQWSIWDWWKTSSNKTIAVEQHFQIDVANKMLKEKIELEVYSNYLNLQSEIQKIELNKLRVESAKENYRIVNNKFNSEISTSTELLEASTLFTEAKIKLITSSIDYKLAKIKLENSIGRKIY
jgi:outer membrane protein